MADYKLPEHLSAEEREDWRLSSLPMEDGGLCDAGTVIRNLRTISDLRGGMKEQEQHWLSLPSGIQEDADENDSSPKDAVAWQAGIAVKAIRKLIEEEAGLND